MAKSTDVPYELRDFIKIFNNFQYRYDDYTVLNDFIDYWIYVLNTDRDPQWIEHFRSRYGKYYQHYVELWHEHIHVMDKMLTDERTWYDLLGTLYECLVSRSKSSRFGQFFTPASLCDLMAKMNAPSDPGPGKRANDPACGSGRTLLAFHCLYPGNKVYGDDLDPICSKMAAINFAIHGCQGQVTNMNSLSLDDWRFGYEINPELYTIGLVSIRPIKKEDCFSLMHWQSVIGNPPVAHSVALQPETAENPSVPPTEAKEALKRANIGHGTQLSLF